MSTRVYHPTANAWQDVPTKDVEKWAEAGWRKGKPGHVDDSAALPPGPDVTTAPKSRPTRRRSSSGAAEVSPDAPAPTTAAKGGKGTE